MNPLKIFRIVTWMSVAIFAGVLIGISGVLLGTQRGQESTSVGSVTIGGSFELISHKGQKVNNAKLAGKPYLVFFGFTNCPDICPMTLFELTDLMLELGSAADKLTPLFITVDPERDTQEQLASYMTSFDKRIIALRGDLEQTDKAVKAFAAYYRKVPSGGGDYTFDHTAGVILIDASGRFAGTLDMHEPREIVLMKLKRLAGA